MQAIPFHWRRTLVEPNDFNERRGKKNSIHKDINI